MNPFEVLGLAPVFAIDLKELEKRHRDLSRALHPDRFIGAGASERRASLNKAVEANEAWRVLRDSVSRAEALFRLAGVAVGERDEPMASPAFLMEVMEWREGLAEARAVRDVAAVMKLSGEVSARAMGSEEVLASTFGPKKPGSHELKLAQVQLGELRFYRRFLEEVSAIEEAWQDELPR